MLAKCISSRVQFMDIDEFIIKLCNLKDFFHLVKISDVFHAFLVTLIKDTFTYTLLL